MSDRSVASTVAGLGRLLQLEWEARQAATMDEIAYLAVNETRQLVPYDRAMIWLPWQRSVRAVSGVTAPERNAPFTQWANRLARHLARRRDVGDSVEVVPDEVPRSLRDGFREWSPGAVLWVPMHPDDAPRPGGLLLMRPQAFADSDRQVLVRIANAYTHALSLLRLRRAGAVSRTGRRAFSRLWLPLALAVVIAALLIPVRLSVLAPAQVVPEDPFVVSTPIDGVVSRITVQPNAEVRKGQDVVLLEESELRARLAVAEKSVDAAEAELARARQRAFSDFRSKADVALLQAKLEEKQTERDFAASRLELARIPSPADGIAIYTDPNDWAGKPVSVGERILTVANPAEVRLDIWIPTGDTVDFAPGAEINFFLNSAPTAPIHGRLESISYDARARPDGSMAYRAKAAFEVGAPPPRLGLTGTAKLHGEEVSLFYLLARRPLAVLRRWTGY